MTFAPALSQGAPTATGVDFKDSSPHFDHIDALTALVGTIVSQLLQSGAPFTDTLGTFRPIVIGSNGVTVNASANHVTTLTFHDTNSAGTDVLMGTRGPSILVLEPNATAANSAAFLVADRDVAGSYAGAQLSASAGHAAVQGTVTAGGGLVSIWSQTILARVKAGAPIDGDYAVAEDGMLVVDSTNNRLWARHGGAWHFVALT